MRRYTIKVNDQQYTIDVQELASDRFRATVNGQEYDVTLDRDEDLAEAAITPAIIQALPAGAFTQQSPAIAPAPAPPSPAAPRPAAMAGGQNVVRAPMPGVILSVEVKAGDQISHGQELVSLEAMKMKNTIRSPRDGTIAEVLVQPGQRVAHHDPLVRFEEGII
jgi:biotin carboxyl carrier protein